MNINGIIAEYNPFHNGHYYHLETSRDLTGADYTVVIMSGNFAQRGAPALLNKYVRAEIALNCGADLVIELPSFYACGSAEYFARGAVSLLDQLGCVTSLCFGSELGELTPLLQVAQLLAEEPSSYRTALSTALSNGSSFPAARSAALRECLGQAASDTILSLPNNILALEYLKALLLRSSSIVPFTIARSGAGYHENVLETKSQNALSSATAIRKHLHTGGSVAELQNQMPAEAFTILSDHLRHTPAMTADHFSALLQYKLLLHTRTGYADFLDVSSDLSDKILKSLDQYTGFDSFCNLLKSKDLTYTRISRSLLHILLDITTAEVNQRCAVNLTPYARVLGLNQKAAPLLRAIKSHSSIPMITKLADAGNLLAPEDYSMLQRDIQISHIYNAAEAAFTQNKCMRNEFRMQIPILNQ